MFIFFLFCNFVGISILLLSFCGLSCIVFYEFFYFDAGGLVGNLLCNRIFSYTKNIFYVQLVLLLISVVGIVFLFFQYFLNIFRKIRKMLCYLTYKNNRLQYDFCRKLYYCKRIYPVVSFENKCILLKGSDNILFEIKRKTGILANIDEDLKKSDTFIEVIHFPLIPISHRKYVCIRSKLINMKCFENVKKYENIFR